MDTESGSVARAVDRLDELDRRILVELQEDGRRSYSDIADAVGVSPGTVRTRVQQMTATGLITVVAVPNLYQLGYRFHALVGIKVEPGHAVDVARALEDEEAITWVGLTATGYDLLVEVAMHDAQEFGRYKEEVLAQLPAFVSADVFVYWDLLKQNYRFKDAGGMRVAGADAIKDSRRRRTPRADDH